MSAFSFRLRIELIPPHGVARLIIRLARDARWAEMRPLVCAAAGLPVDTVLYHGVGPVEDHWPVGAPPLLAGCTLSTRPAAAHPHRPPLVLSVVSGPDAGTWAPVGTCPLSIGRQRDADLPLTDPAVSRHHARISPHPAGLIVTDVGSVNGVLVDGVPAGDGTVATTGSVIRLGGTLLQVQLTTEPPGGFRADGRGYLVRAGRPTRFQERLPALPPRPSAPEPPPRRSVPLLTALIGAAVGGVLALVLHNAMFLAFAALGPVMMIGNALGDRIRGRRSYRRQLSDHRAAVAEWRQAAARRTGAERQLRWRRWPGPGELARRATAMSGRLWDRRRSDADYLHVAAGHGSTSLVLDGATPASGDASSNATPAPVAGPAAGIADRERGGSHLARSACRMLLGRRRSRPEPTAGADDDGANHAGALSLSDVPLVVPLTEAPGGVVGFAGPAERAIARFVLAQLACHHAPSDLALAVIGAGADWEACRDLPHHLPFAAGPTSDTESAPASIGRPGPADPWPARSAPLSFADGGSAWAAGPSDETDASAARVTGIPAVATSAGPGRPLALADAGSPGRQLPLSAQARPVNIGRGDALSELTDAPDGLASADRRGTAGGPPSRHVSLGALTGSRDLVVLLDGPDALSSPVGTALLAAAGERAVASADPRGPASRLIVLAVADSTDELPVQAAPLSGLIATTAPPPASATGPRIPPTRGLSAAGVAGYTRVSAPLLAEICRALAPLRDGRPDATGPGAALNGPGDGGITLADLGDAVPSLTAAGVHERWSRPSARAALGMTVAAPGAGSAGPTRAGAAPVDTAPDAVTALDLDADGPHLLIAGTTGSGKSELLQTLITSWALAAPPTATTFLLVDYKGGAAFGPIRALPHVVGMLTDLDPATSARALTSLRAELRRREQEQNTGLAPPPKLVLVIDEFATLAAELPEFLTGVLDIAQRGRSLGLHLVLATQRPAGVVSPAMRANISARICLRVTDPADSLDVLGIPDAAGIPAGQPGRAILRTGRGIDTFQTARVTVPVPPDIVISGGPAGTVTSRPHDVASGDADADIVTRAVRATAEAAAGLPPPRRPWLEPLPARIVPSPGKPTLLARADLPDKQAREDLAAPEGPVLIVGPPGSGRSTALRRIAEIAVHRGEELLVVDGADTLQDLRTWPEVSSYLTARDPALVLRLLSLLADPARQPADGRRRHLIVDQYDIVAAELERADYLLGSSLLSELAARTNQSVRISATGPERLAQQRVASSFTEIIALGGTASPHGRAASDGCAADMPGRGRWRGAEVQLVDAARRPSPSSRTPWADALVVRPLPALVPVSALPHSDPAHVTIGFGGDSAEPCALDLTREGGGIVVAGPRRGGVTTALALLAAQAAAAGIPVLRVLTRHCRRHAVPAEVPAGTASSPAADPVRDPGRGDASGDAEDPTARLSDGAPADGAPIIDIPCPESPEPLRAALAAHEGPVLVIADHHGLGDDHPAAAVLERFLAVCGPGQHLAIGARFDVLARTRRGHLHAALAARRGLLLAPDKADGALFDIPLPPRRGAVPPGRGVLVWDAAPIPAQIAFPSPTAPPVPDGQRLVIPAAPTTAAPARPSPDRPESATGESIPVSSVNRVTGQVVDVSP